MKVHYHVKIHSIAPLKSPTMTIGLWCLNLLLQSPIPNFSLVWLPQRCQNAPLVGGSSFSKPAPVQKVLYRAYTPSSALFRWKL